MNERQNERGQSETRRPVQAGEDRDATGALGGVWDYGEAIGAG